MSNALILTLIWLAAAGTAVVLVSFAIEALRPIPATPERLPWAPDIPVRYVTINGIRLRYITAGPWQPLRQEEIHALEAGIAQMLILALAKYEAFQKRLGLGVALQFGLDGGQHAFGAALRTREHR